MTAEATLDAIVRHARARPGDVAAIANGTPVTYAQLAGSVGRFARALDGLGLGAGQSMAIQCVDQYLHLLLLLAAEHRGIATASFAAADFEQSVPLPSGLDLVLAERPGRPQGARRVQPITEEWVKSVFALPGDPGPAAPAAPGDRIRILRTSGTTGAPKHIALTRSMLEGRVGVWADKERFTPADRSLMAAPYTFALSHYLSLVALRAGAGVVFDNRIGLAEAVTLHRVTQVTMVVHQLRELLDRLPAGFAKPARLSLSTIGGRLPEEMRARTLARLATRLSDGYGSNELGTVAHWTESDPDAHSTVFPGVAIEIVDDERRPLPPGRLGELRIRTSYMADRYLDDADATAKMFRDGWFHPGDLGILHPSGRLEIVGRSDDLLNIGGIKVLPEELEQHMRGRVRVADLAICALPNAQGFDEAWIAVVYDAPDDSGIRALMRPAFADFPFGQAHLVKLPAIPRTETGKIKRAELRQAVAAERERTGAR